MPAPSPGIQTKVCWIWYQLVRLSSWHWYGKLCQDWNFGWLQSRKQIKSHMRWVWIKLYYLDNHAHSNWQERVYLYPLSCLKNGGRHSLNLVWGYTWTLPLFFRQERVWGYTLFCALEWAWSSKQCKNIHIHMRSSKHWILSWMLMLQITCISWQ